MPLLISLALGLGACVDPDPQLMVVSMPGCVFQGPSSMDSGSLRITLRAEGLGAYGLALLQLSGSRSYDDLVEHVEARSGVWDPPDWVTLEADLRVGAEGQDPSTSETVELGDGEYAVVCIEYPYDDGEAGATPAGRLVVG
jgi:hypothetical protein